MRDDNTRKRLRTGLELILSLRITRQFTYRSSSYSCFPPRFGWRRNGSRYVRHGGDRCQCCPQLLLFDGGSALVLSKGNVTLFPRHPVANGHKLTARAFSKPPFNNRRRLIDVRMSSQLTRVTTVPAYSTVTGIMAATNNSSIRSLSFGIVKAVSFWENSLLAPVEQDSRDLCLCFPSEV